MCIIVPKVINLKNRVISYGHPFENTMEIIGAQMTLSVHHMNLDEEIGDVKVFFGPKYEDRSRDEYHHYQMLSHGLLHKVNETKYFFKCGNENRKVILFSNDCISMIQYLIRGRETFLYVHMRSSDIVGLLPLDLLNLALIFDLANKNFCPVAVSAIMNVCIGSAHVYLQGGRDD